jgi:tRNA(Ile)-lysidine synthase
MPPPLAVAQVRSAVRAMLAGCGPTVLVACSGGADSLALAAAAAFEAPRAGIRAGLITIDHGLQPGSAEQAGHVAALGFELGLDPVEVVPVRVGGAGGPEAAARTARYGALDAAAEALDATVLLGHTLDDQAETVLLGLGRGSGSRSLAGMRPVDGRYRRPLLGLRRGVTVAACRALGLAPWDDPQNRDPRFQRVRLRLDVLPRLEDALQGGVAEALARTAELLRDDADALDGWACDVLRRLVPSGAVTALDVDALVELPRAVRSRVVRRWLTDAGTGPLTAERTAAVEALLSRWHGQGAVDLPGGAAVRRRSGRLELIPPDTAQE